MEVGVDISKLTFDAAVRNGTKLSHVQFNNNQEGYEEFATWVRGCGDSRPHICMEATGRYGEGLASFCFEMEWQVSVVNARQVKHFGHARLERHKTDKVDAQVLLAFCEKMEPKIWNPRVRPELHENEAAIQLVKKSIVQIQNFLSSGIESVTVIDAMNSQIESLNESLKTLEARAEKLISMDSELKESRVILKSIIGFGDTTIRYLLSRIDFSKFPDARALTTFFGLNPRKYTSGTSVQKHDRISRVGHTEQRSALYFPAVVAMTHDPNFRRFADRLRERGKPKKVIIVAVMRKLLALACALLRSKQLYDPMRNMSK
jgi:transposase